MPTLRTTADVRPVPRLAPARRPGPGQPIDELVVAARAGDLDAAGELYRRTWSRARRVAAAFCRAEDADDAAAEGLSRALMRLDQLREPARAEAWLMRCVVRAAIDQSRQHQRRRALGTLAGLDGRDPGVVESAAEQALGALDRYSMAEAIGDLRPAWRRLLLLRYGSPLPLRTIAAALNTPEGTLRRQCVEARRHAGQQFLYRQLRPVTDLACARVTNLLCQEPYRRPAPRQRRQANEHLRRCRGCRDRQHELACVLHELGYRPPR